MNVFFPKTTVFSMDVEQDIEGAMAFFDFLNEANQKGEFFFTGRTVLEHPAECKKISKKHFVGAHGFEHENFSRLVFSGQKKIVERVQEVFSERSISLGGWRFPRFQFNSASMRLLVEKNLPDFSLSEQKLKQWGNNIFLWNFLKCALAEKTLFVPFPFPRALEEHPFSSVDLFEKNFPSLRGRIVLHCYNFKNIKSYGKEH
jgi:hypothetical protein